ncbi:hypothetical protein JCM21714_4269 [Gracilibacillus boraciitolerans JCM 21714]|uniref:Uncharacterized protein n=1 Tax=Gracilibacillus boraciitolerans JCM 21714 TaxID=1298598 RepID=W4VPH2_9BACI|nr:DUF6470 family protein [Gracilibacillus boraciitolerans]GAE95061.1 hypothetical protein JCM21714_4269 [Gracilibacillus boraciitolerans JCM 21714]
MQLPQIRIQQQNARIGIQTKNAQLSLEAGPAKQEIKQPKADLQIHTTKGKLTIDQSKALADVGIIPTGESIRKMANEAMQTAMEGSKKRRRQGDMLMKIENGGNPLAIIAKQNGQRSEKQFNIGWIPSGDAVKFDYQPAEVNIVAKANKPIIHTQPTENQFNYQRGGGIDVYLQQENSINIDFVNVKFVGNNFEMEV